MPTTVFTKIESSRCVVRVDDIQKFRIVTVCTAAGNLPDTGIFVHRIVDPDDPSQDEFDRVSEIADFEQYPHPVYTDRVSAVAAGSEYWRSYLLTKFYTDIGVANAAKTAIQDRVDELVSGYATYVDSFRTLPTEQVSLPTGTDTLLQSLNNTYNTAYDAYESAVADEATAQTAKDDADAELTAAESQYQGAQAVKTSAVARTQEMSAAYSAMTTFGTSADTIIGAIDTFKISAGYPTGDTTVDNAIDTLMVARNNFAGNNTTFKNETSEALAGVTNHGGHETLIESDVVTPATTALTTAESDVRSTTQALAEAEAATAVAYAALEAAYNAAKSACSSWTPDSGKSFPPIS